MKSPRGGSRIVYTFQYQFFQRFACNIRKGLQYQYPPLPRRRQNCPSFLHRPPLMESTAEVVHRLAVTPISNVPTPRSPAGCPVPPWARDPITIMCTWKENYGDQASVGRVFYVATAQECLPSDTCLRSFCGRRRSGRPPRNAENNAK